MDKSKLEFRMYGFVPYNISEIQKGIQFGHAVVEYGRYWVDTPEYVKWSAVDKTFIILNGGTTNAAIDTETGLPKGTLNQMFSDFTTRGILVAGFIEPDLNEALSAFVFLVDERVYDREKYPDIIPMWQIKKFIKQGQLSENTLAILNGEAQDQDEFNEDFAEWVKQFECGDLDDPENFNELNQILFLRSFLPKHKLA